MSSSPSTMLTDAALGVQPGVLLDVPHQRFARGHLALEPGAPFGFLGHEADATARPCPPSPFLADQALGERTAAAV